MQGVDTVGFECQKKNDDDIPLAYAYLCLRVRVFSWNDMAVFFACTVFNSQPTYSKGRFLAYAVPIIGYGLYEHPSSTYVIT